MESPSKWFLFLFRYPHLFSKALPYFLIQQDLSVLSLPQSWCQPWFQSPESFLRGRGNNYINYNEATLADLRLSFRTLPPPLLHFILMDFFTVLKTLEAWRSFFTMVFKYWHSLFNFLLVSVQKKRLTKISMGTLSKKHLVSGLQPPSLFDISW